MGIRAALKIVLLCVGGAIAYGLVHDQITARVCQEYFTLGHNTPAFVPRNPTALGLFWGVAATWWVGLAIGVPLAAAMRLGKLPPLEAKWLAPRLVRLLLAMLGIALAGLALTLFADLADRVPAGWKAMVPGGVPAEKSGRFVADGVAHNLSYAAGFLGGVQLWIAALLTRRRLRMAQAAVQSPS
jgi:hypothetical protein